MVRRRSGLINTREEEKKGTLSTHGRNGGLVNIRRIFCLALIVLSVLDCSEASQIRQKREDCECAGGQVSESPNPLKCRCHTGDDAYDQICRCARSIMSSCGCPFSQQQPQMIFNSSPMRSYTSSCKPACERSCTQSCTAQLQPAPQCAATCQFTCQKTCSEFQVNSQPQQTSSNQQIPHVLIVGGTPTPPICQCPKAEPTCPCNCFPRCQQNCQQNCQANGQPQNQCSSTCTQTCHSTCLANTIVQEPASSSTSTSQVCTQKCPSSCQKVCVKLTLSMPLCQQQCVQTCNINCLTMTTPASSTPEPYTVASNTPPARDCVPVCQPACLKSCTSIYQGQSQSPQPTYNMNTMPNFGYLYGPQIGQGAQPQTQQCIQPCMPLCEPSCVNDQQPTPAPTPAPTSIPVATPLPTLPPQQQQLVTITLCIPQCMPDCQSTCIQNVANALSQQLQQSASQQGSSCPVQCQPACRPSCIQSVVNQQAQQSVPLPAEAVSCPVQCQPACQPSCLMQRSSYISTGLQQNPPSVGVISPSPSNIPARMVAPSIPVAPSYAIPSQTGHLQSGHEENRSNKFSMLNNKNQLNSVQNSPSNGQPKTCISACMPLCLDECVNAGMEPEKSATFNQRDRGSRENNTNFSNGNQFNYGNRLNNFVQTTTTPPTTPQTMPNNFAFNVINGQGSGNPVENEKPMRVMIQYTAQNTPSTTPLSTNSQVQTTTPLISKLMPASMVGNNFQRNPSDPFDPSNISKQTPNPRFHIGTSTHQPLQGVSTTTSSPQPSIIHPVPGGPGTKTSGSTRSLDDVIRQKCESSCQKVCDAECRKQKNPPDEICVLTCHHDCVSSCSRRVTAKIARSRKNKL